MPLFASDFDRPPRLKTADVPAPKKLRIASIAKEIVGGELKAVLYFVGLDAGWILNTTNRRVIAETLGDDMLAWIGKVIIVYPDMVDFEDRLVPGLRCRVPKQKDPPAPVAASSVQRKRRGSSSRPRRISRRRTGPRRIRQSDRLRERERAPARRRGRRRRRVLS